jgi:hypothetical protein
VRVLEGLMLRTERDLSAIGSSLASSQASVISNAENGFSNVAALGLRTLRSLAWRTEADPFFEIGALSTPGFMGVAGASWGIEADACVADGAAGGRFPMLSMAGSTKGCVARAGAPLLIAGAG